MIDCTTCKNCTPEETDRCYRCANDFENGYEPVIGKAQENIKIVYEIEKIKAEIKDLDLGFFDEDYRAGVARGIMEFNKILNSHISELKGE